MYFSDLHTYINSRKHCSLKPETFAVERDVIGLLTKTRVIFPSVYAESDTFLSEMVMEDYIDSFFVPSPQKNTVCDILAALRIL